MLKEKNEIYLGGKEDERKYVFRDRVLDGERIGYEGPANRRRARIEAFG